MARFRWITFCRALDAICQVTEQVSQPREENDTCKKLEELGSFAPSRQEKRGSAEAEFVFKLRGLMGTEGIQAGLSGISCAARRLTIVSVAPRPPCVVAG